MYTALSSDHVTAAIDAAENLLELQVIQSPTNFASHFFPFGSLALPSLPFFICFSCSSFVFNLVQFSFQGKDGVDVEVYEVLFKKLPIAAANMTSGGSSSLISRGIALLSRASGLCSDNVQLWTLYAGFMEKHGRADAAAMLDIRLHGCRD